MLCLLRCPIHRPREDDIKKKSLFFCIIQVMTASKLCDFLYKLTLLKSSYVGNKYVNFKYLIVNHPVYRKRKSNFGRLSFQGASLYSLICRIMSMLIRTILRVLRTPDAFLFWTSKRKSDVLNAGVMQCSSFECHAFLAGVVPELSFPRNSEQQAYPLTAQFVANFPSFQFVL